MRLHYPQIILILVCYLIRVIVLSIMGLNLAGDGAIYVAQAQEILQSWMLPELRVQPIGYPVLLATLQSYGTEISLSHISLFQKFADAVLVLILIVIAWRILDRGGSWKITIFCCAIALQPFTGTMVSLLYTEVFVTLLTFIGLLLSSLVYVKTRKSIFLLTGFFLLGLAGTMRIDVLVLNFLIALTLASYFKVKSTTFSNSIAISSGLAVLLFPAMILLWQFSSTNQFGFVDKKFHYDGYFSWLRTWPVDQYNYPRFAFFSTDEEEPVKFNVASYPTKAFSSESEKYEIAVLLDLWRNHGYNENLDHQFRSIAESKRSNQIFRYYVSLPLERMARFWLNIDGAQFYIATLNIKRPLSLLTVAAVTFIRGLFLIGFLFSCGFFLFGKTTRDSPTSVFCTVCISYVLLRTLELGALSTVAWGGLMELRYVTVAFPPLIIASLFGYKRLFDFCACDYSAQSPKLTK